MQTDGLQFVRGNIFATERVVDTQKDKPPTRFDLNLGHDFQNEQGYASTHWLALPGTDPEEIGQCVLVGVVEPQQARERRESFVFGGAYQ